METDDDVPETARLFSSGLANQDGRAASPWEGLSDSGPQHVRSNPGTTHSANVFPGHLLNEPDFKRRKGEWGGEWSFGGDSAGSPMELV